MKVNLLPFASLMLFLVLIGCNEASDATDTSKVEKKASNGEGEEQPQAEASWTLYGSEIGTDAGLAANDVRNLLDDSGQAEARFEGIIDATCAKKGCWMSMVSDEDTVFVQFKDYGFFVPTEGMEGKRALQDRPPLIPPPCMIFGTLLKMPGNPKRKLTSSLNPSSS